MDLKGAAAEIITARIVQAASAAVPFFKIPGVAWLFKLVVGKVIQYATHKTELALMLKRLEIEQAVNVERMRLAREKLDQAQTDSEKINADKEFKNAFRDLVLIPDVELRTKAEDKTT